MQVRIENQNNNQSIKLDDHSFQVPKHWFWEQFAQNWEPQTFKFFKNNLIPETDYVDIGAWVGPTALIATALGAKKCRIIEPNPKNFLFLMLTQFNNPSFFDKWSLVNACVASSRDYYKIGPLEGINSGSSATNIREIDQSGAEIISVKIEDIVFNKINPSLIKIDIEGAEAFIVEDLVALSNLNAATWLSIHPPFIENKLDFTEKFFELASDFFLTNENNQVISETELKMMILTSETHPEWGTKYGNFFEVGLLPKKFFNETGQRFPN